MIGVFQARSLRTDIEILDEHLAFGLDLPTVNNPSIRSKTKNTTKLLDGHTIDI